MSKATFKDVHNEILDQPGKYNQIKDIEIVPRKMVEMIIERCEEDSAQPFYHDCIIEEARDIKRYAEALLEQFEFERG